MKRFLLVLVCLTVTFFVNAQNVGIGTTTPDASALLHVDLGASTTKGLLINGTPVGTSTVPNLGAGTRLMFYPGKAAFRAGYAGSTEWDNINVGYFSTATGNRTTASGLVSTAIGYNTTASGDVSTAMGYFTTASGLYSTALGQSTTASGAFSTSIGSSGQANSEYSVAIGESVTANSWISTSLGRHNDPIVPSPTTSWVLTEPLLIVGNGTGPSDKKNSFAIAKNGNIYIDPSNKNDGTLTGNTLLFGTFNGTGEGIASKRTAGSNQYGLDFYTGSATRMSITNGGNVGIGTSSPGEKLTILSADNNSVTNIGAFYPNNLSQGIGIGYDEIRKIGTNANSNLFINAKGSGNLILENSATGNVGIGTASPATKLHISAGDASLALFGPDSYGAMLYVGASANNQSAALTAQVVTSDGNLHIDPALGKNIYMGYFQARNIYLNPLGGNVGIGTTTPVNTLDVTGNAGSAGNFVNTSTLVNSGGVIGFCNNIPDYGFGILGYGGHVGVEGVAGLAGAGDRYGGFGVGSSGTGYNYGMYGSASGGTAAYGIYGTASGATTNYAGYFSGNVFCSGTYVGSDRKLKNEIRPLSDAMSIINQLKPSVYTFKTNEYKQMNLPEGLQYGLIADEVQQVLPGAVKKAVQPAEYENHDEKKGKKLSDEVEFNAVNYTEMIPILIAGMKEQQAIITGMQKQIDELKKPVKQ